MNNLKEPTIIVEININFNKWKNCIKNINQHINSVIKTVISHTKYKNTGKEIEISILLTNDKQIRQLNKNYRNKDKATNVLSFPFENSEENEFFYNLGSIVLGDIIISHEYIVKECEETHKNLKDHFTHLLIHGILHLLGYDHIEDKDAKIMETLEIKILSEFNIVNPYID